MDFKFCGTKSDLSEVIADVESLKALRYYLANFYATLPIPSVPTLIGPELGIAFRIPKSYYVLPEELEVGTEFIGGNNQKYGIDHGKNLKAVTITPSGVFEDGRMVWGEVRATSTDPDSIALFNIFKKAFKSRFQFVKPIYLGREAEELFDKGWYVMPFYNSRAECNLKRHSDEEPYTNQLQMNPGQRLSFMESCKLLMQEDAPFCGQFIASGGDRETEPYHPSGVPRPDIVTGGLRFFGEFVGGADPEEEELVLEHLSLPSTFINRSELISVSFLNTDLSESFICWNDVKYVDFSDADLHGSDLRANAFENVSFNGANLSNTDFRFSVFEKCTFSGALMNGCKLHLSKVESLELSPNQRREIVWCREEGPEPPGG